MSNISLAGGGGSGRSLLTGTTNYYVTTTGDDSHGNGSISKPWATLQHAFDFLAVNIDFGGQQVIINVGAGTFVGIGMRSMLGGGNLLVKGAGSSQTTIAAGDNDNVYNFGDAITHNVQTETILSVDKVTLTSNIGYCVDVIASGIIMCVGDFVSFTGADIVFGPAVGAALGMFGPALLFTAPGNYSINMGASCGHFIDCANVGQMQLDGTFTCVGTTNFTTAFQTIFGNASVFWISYSFVNPANFTGIRAHVFGDGYLNTSGVSLTSFPGSIMPTIGTGGMIDADKAVEGEDLILMQKNTFASLPTAAGNDGMLALISDAPFPAQVGSFVTVGGGTIEAEVRSDGTNWIIVSSNYAERYVMNSFTQTWYVATTGSDVTGTGTATNPWATPEHAWQYIAQNIDLAGGFAVIQMAAGDYPGVALNFSNAGGGYIQFQGDPSNVGNVTINAGHQKSFGFANLSKIEPIVYLSDLTIYSQIDVTGQIYLRLGDGAGVGSGNLTLKGVSNDLCIRLGSNGGFGAVLEDDSNVIIVDFSATPTVRGFLDIDDGAMCSISNITTVVTGTGCTQAQFIKANGKSLVQWNCGTPVVSGTGLTGQKFLIDTDSTIEVFGSGLNCIPGSTPGQINSGTYCDADPHMYSGISIGWMFPIAFASLPSPASPGMFGYITDGLATNCADGSCTTFGTAVTGGGGALKLFVWYNGTNWTLMGK